MSRILGVDEWWDSLTDEEREMYEEEEDLAGLGDAMDRI